MNATTAIWIGGVECRLLDEFPGYAIGRDGSVWSKWNWRCGAFAHGLVDEWRKLTDRYRFGYSVLILKHRGTKKQKCMRVHRLVLLAFIGPPAESDFEACHVNGNSRDNRLENLRWDTVKANRHDKRTHGTIRLTGGKKLTDEAAIDIRRTYAAGGVTQKQIAERYGVNRATISYLLSGKTWRA